MNARDTINLYAALADMKEVDCQHSMAISAVEDGLEDLKRMVYKNTLALTALLDLLVEKGLITKAEVAQRAQHLESEHLDSLGK